MPCAACGAKSAGYRAAHAQARLLVDGVHHDAPAERAAAHKQRHVRKARDFARCQGPADARIGATLSTTDLRINAYACMLTREQRALLCELPDGVCKGPRMEAALCMPRSASTKKTCGNAVKLQIRSGLAWPKPQAQYLQCASRLHLAMGYTKELPARCRRREPGRALCELQHVRHIVRKALHVAAHALGVSQALLVHPAHGVPARVELVHPGARVLRGLAWLLPRSKELPDARPAKGAP